MSHGGGSKGQAFDLKIYPELLTGVTQPGAPQSYVGRAMDDITLDGYYNKDYLIPQLVEQFWHLDSTGDGQLDTTIAADSDGKAVFQWPVIAGAPTAVYDVTYEVKLTTAEGFVLTDTDSTTVTIDAEMPTAYPGGPYRGGIAGGNFSPIQLSGNHPDFVESEDIGHIVDWVRLHSRHNQCYGWSMASRSCSSP